MATKPYSVIREKMTPESRARAQKKAQRMLAQMPLFELRQARTLTQEQIAGILGKKQAEISKIEHRTDMYLSTLRKYIEAIGGSLEIVAHFPDGDVQIEQFGQLELA